MFEPESIRNFFIFVLIVGGLIFLHELGHFIAAIRLGVKVKEFGIGFPPRLFGAARDKNGIRRWFFGKAPDDLDPDEVIYSINWIPVGGFVKPAGEDDPTVLDGLSASPKLTRLVVLAAGSAMNLLVGVIVFTLAFATGYPQYTQRVMISGVVMDAPADLVGLKPGDIVISANGETVTADTNRLSEITRSNLGQPVRLVIERGGETLSITVVPRTEWPEGQGPMGITLDQEWTLATLPLPQAFINSIGQVGFQIQETFMMPVRVIVGQIQASEVRFVSVVGIKQINDVVVDTAVEMGSLFPILQFTGMITVALALTNLLPLPALDGGRILFVLIEAARRRRVDPLREGYVHIMGMLALLALMAALVINDLLNPVVLR
ncbi:MAG: site-2 protease family protein [Chloroflexi bacterium]|nr:site-2 protease family protein [Chloroflexota bacterium]